MSDDIVDKARFLGYCLTFTCVPLQVSDLARRLGLFVRAGVSTRGVKPVALQPAVDAAISLVGLDLGGLDHAVLGN
jgi:hypothetical protein